MGELTARAFTEQNLLNAWHAVGESALEDGAAGPEVERFEAAAARRSASSPRSWPMRLLSRARSSG